MSAATQPTQPVILRTAAVWGTSVIAVDDLRSGASLHVGDGEHALIPKPNDADLADLPIRAVGQGWELDARGATGGKVFLRGREEDPAELAKSGAPIPIVAGDYGLIQYGNFSLFFQFSYAPPVIKRRNRFDFGLVLSFVFALVAVLGGLALIWAITTPAGIPKPLELTSQAELALQFNLKTEEEPPPEPVAANADDGKGIKDPGAKDKQEQGGGKKIKGTEGSLGKQGVAEKTELKGEPKAGLGGMAEVLASDVGEEVAKTLGTISSVADALGGLRSDQIVLGRGSGTGLKGSGSAGGGTEEGGVPFGSGTLDTGWGPGKGGGFGTGRGGPGGRGLGGTGRGGTGDGEGSGTGDGAERKVQGADAPKAGMGLTPAQISRVVNSRMGAFRACYEGAAARDPNLKGTVNISWHIDPGGSVAGASVGGSSLGNARVEGCVLRQVKRLRFPVADKGTNASFPFAFRPSAK